MDQPHPGRGAPGTARRVDLTSALRRICLGAALGLAGCQAGGLGDGLESAKSAPAALASSSYGSGPVRITLLLPTDSAMRTRAADIADGAKLALDDLGAGQLGLDIEAFASDSGQAAAKVQAAGAAGSKLIVGPASNGDVRQIVAGTGSAARPPILSLVADSPAGGPGVWPLYGDAVDSAIEGAGAAVAAKQKNIAVVHETSFSADDLKRLQDGIRLKGGTTVGLVPYPAGGANLKAAFARAKPLFAKANAVVLLGGGETIGQVIDILATGDFGETIATAVATSLLPEAMYKRPTAQGLIVATPSTTDLRVIATRFQAKYGRAPSYDAAIGYDAIAIAAGLVRASGPEAITARNLTSAQGFRAATGLFRFRADGRIERRMIVHRIVDGGLKVIQEEGEGF
ncbi:hypothetical protein [Hoeflea olei]|uniref:hypothetical protein n=1 Tax=Hoeflea olei TaxID=1480615 RepID=UPI001111CD85|nr:hypothetical protein [Hoeflea olei]